MSKMATRRLLLHEAVRKNSWLLKDLLKRGIIKVDFKDENGNTGLHIAAYNGLIKSASILLDNGANIHIKDKDGHTPIQVATLGNQLLMVKLLLNRGANVNNCMRWLDGLLANKQIKIFNLLLCFSQSGHTRITKAEREAYYVKNSSDIRKQRLRGIEGTYTYKDIEAIWESQNGKCYFCGTSLGKITRCQFHKDHLTPVSKGGTNWPSNIALTCGLCNQRKHGKDEATFWRVLVKEHGKKWAEERRSK